MKEEYDTKKLGRMLWKEFGNSEEDFYEQEVLWTQKARKVINMVLTCTEKPQISEQNADPKKFGE